jgi:hypothetical protein
MENKMKVKSEVYLKSISASEHAVEINTENRSSNSGWPYSYPEVPEYWAKLGIHSGIDLERAFLGEEFSDTYKANRGFRPTGMSLSSLTLNELRDLVQKESDKTNEISQDMSDWDQGGEW